MAETSIGAALEQASNILQDNSPTPMLDAECLIRHLLDKDETWLIAHATDKLDDQQRNQFARLVERRIAGEPVAYLVGWKEFWSLRFEVNNHTLIPRPETELVVEIAIAHINHGQPATILDLGTGSGAIGIAIALERPESHVIAIDNCIEALQVARSNSRSLGVDNIELMESDYFSDLNGRVFDMIVSNPPYVSSDDLHLTRGDLRFEPLAALAGGPCGLEAIRRICQQAGRHLVPAGHLIIEHGFEQTDAVVHCLQQAAFHRIQTHRDLAGHNRVICAQAKRNN